MPGVFFNARCWLVFDVEGTRKTVVCLKISWMLQNSFAAQAPRLAVWPGMGLRGFDSWCYFPEDFHWLFTKGPFSMDIPVLLWLLLYGFLKPWEDMETVRQHIKSLLNLVVRAVTITEW